MSQKAKLRVCASCEWIFLGGVECPKCEFGSYGARYVYGNKAYHHFKTQKPWKDKKLEDFEHKLDKEIKETSQWKTKGRNFYFDMETYFIKKNKDNNEN